VKRKGKRREKRERERGERDVQSDMPHLPILRSLLELNALFGKSVASLLNIVHRAVISIVINMVVNENDGENVHGDMSKPSTFTFIPIGVDLSIFLLCTPVMTEF
jgi:hypothetical protein